MDITIASQGQPPPTQVRPHSTKGRALHATRRFRPGDVLQSFAPLILLPTLSQLASVCAYCLRPGSPKACTRCWASFYCNGGCQAADWAAVHGRECRALKRAQAQPARARAARAGGPSGASEKKQVPTPVRALLRVLLALGEDEGSKVRVEMAAAMQKLEGHVQARLAGKDAGDLRIMAMAACSFAGKGDDSRQVQQAVELLCKIQNNAFHRFDADLEQAGVFLNQTLAMANHSCVPNATVQFIGRDAFLRADLPIESGDEIEISYTDYTHSLSRRNKALASYHFACSCRRCKENLNVYQVCADTLISEHEHPSLVSDNAAMKQHVATRDPDLQLLATKMNRSADHSIDLLESLPESPRDRREVLGNFLSEVQPLIAGGLWAVSPLPQILAEITITYAQDSDFSSALTLACLVALHCEPFRHVSPSHPARVKSLNMVAKLLASTAPEAAMNGRSVTSVVSTNGSIGKRVVETLQNIDQVALCQMLLLLVKKQLPAGVPADQEPYESVQRMLEDIEQLPGRSKETALIETWNLDPWSDSSQAFFAFGVVKQVETLAQLAPDVLKRDFGS